MATISAELTVTLIIITVTAQFFKAAGWEVCTCYIDANGLTHVSFQCPQFCCGSHNNKYCCSNEDLRYTPRQVIFRKRAQILRYRIGTSEDGSEDVSHPKPSRSQHDYLINTEQHGNRHKRSGSSWSASSSDQQDSSNLTLGLGLGLPLGIGFIVITAILCKICKYCTKDTTGDHWAPVIGRRYVTSTEFDYGRHRSRQQNRGANDQPDHEQHNTSVINNTNRFVHSTDSNLPTETATANNAPTNAPPSYETVNNCENMPVPQHIGEASATNDNNITTTDPSPPTYSDATAGLTYITRSQSILDLLKTTSK